MIQFCNLRILRSMCARAAKRLARLRSEEGATLMETAVTLPVFLGALAVGASVSLGLYNVQQLSNASSIAITAVAENRGLTADPCKLAVSSITATLPHWTAGNFTYTLTISYPTSTGTTSTVTYGPTTGSGFTCPAGVGYQAENYAVTLKVGYAYSWLPIVGSHSTGTIAATEGTMSY
jgi:Flp pilus assembly protein TadG